MGKFWTYALYVGIGVGFGVALEVAGFSVSTKLTGQFYMRDQTVFKVMFTGVIVAMVLVFGAAALGWLDFNRVWVPETYLMPGIIGGFLIGVGFIIGGFCPGTSIMAAATGKIDAIFFVGGVLIGIVIFGEQTSSFEGFYNSTYMGRFLLPDWLGMSTGMVVFIVTVVGLFLIWGADQIEKAISRKADPDADLDAAGPDAEQATSAGKRPLWLPVGVGLLVLAAFGVMAVGQPDVADMWARVAPVEEARLADRLVQIHPAELRSIYYDTNVNLVMLDVRDEANYNLFHLAESQRMDLEDLPGAVRDLQALPANTVYVMISNGETLSTAAWKTLTALELKNVYILEGGINNWITVYGEGEYPRLASMGGDESLDYLFSAALGANAHAAVPSQHDEGILFTPKVELQSTGPSGGGGCG